MGLYDPKLSCFLSLSRTIQSKVFFSALLPAALRPMRQGSPKRRRTRALSPCIKIHPPAHTPPSRYPLMCWSGLGLANVQRMHSLAPRCPAMLPPCRAQEVERRVCIAGIAREGEGREGDAVVCCWQSVTDTLCLNTASMSKTLSGGSLCSLLLRAGIEK